jgi:hypothetical protein
MTVANAMINLHLLNIIRRNLRSLTDSLGKHLLCAITNCALDDRDSCGAQFAPPELLAGEGSGLEVLAVLFI